MVAPESKKIIEVSGWNCRVARWQNLDCIPRPFPPTRRNPRKEMDQIVQCSGAIVLQDQMTKHIQSNNLAIAIWQPWMEEAAISIW